MSNYVKATNFTAKDSLPSGNAGKIIKGTEIDTEYTAIASAISSKADLNSPALTGTPTAPTASAGTNTTQLSTTAHVFAERTNTATLTNKTLTSPVLNTPTINTPTISTPAITGGTITGITDLTVADGGTGVSTISANAVVLGNGTSAIQTVDPSTSGNVLTSNGTTWTSATPAAIGVGQTWQSVSRTAGTTYTNSTGKPIMFMMSFASGAGGNENVTLTIGGVSLNFIYGVLVSGVVFGQNTAIIPNGSTYSYTDTAGVGKSIYELR